jgi:3-hydroxymyristoyl/3-hydroxydecanoyl-(acyl carrier protein) dehydratase
MIAQLGGRCIRSSRTDVLTVLGSVQNAKFRKNITPGDQAIIFAEVTAIRSSYSSVRGWIEVEGEKVCEADIRYGHVPIPLEMQSLAKNEGIKIPSVQVEAMQ